MIMLCRCAICRGRGWLRRVARGGGRTIEPCKFCKGRGGHPVNLAAANDDEPRARA